MDNKRTEALKIIDSLRERGVNPYPEKFPKEHLLAEAMDFSLEQKVVSAGRILTIRTMGRLNFAHIQDGSGKMQVVIKEDVVGKEAFSFFKQMFGIGDFIGVEGEIFVTKAGEKSILVHTFEFLGKSLHTLPEKWSGVKDTETKYRQRYLDLIANRESMDLARFRTEVIKTLRQFYWEHGFIEVETPTLMHKATGAVANPYRTHHDALDIDLFLRISHELPLKELIVGGFEKIFEIGKAFRNEGIDPSHLPEHTHLEHYAAYWNYEDNMDFTEEMFSFLLERLSLTKEIILEDGARVNFSLPWPRLNFVELLKKETGLDVVDYDDADAFRADLQKKKIDFSGFEEMSFSGLVDHLYKKVVRPKLLNPVFLYGYPAALQPLARKNDNDQAIVDQFQLVINGWEVVKAYSELVDPVDQEVRFRGQAEAQAKGASEVMEIDEEYLKAMSYGMPPISGLGIGVDRLVALLAGKLNLRDVVLFPLLRPEEKE
jgi:lysyl-tRNA synthetase class 2